MTTARDAAVRRAMVGIDWRYPCLLWVADYLLDETGQDLAEAFRAVEWNERKAMRHLRALAAMSAPPSGPGQPVGGPQGECLVERALDAAARWNGWVEADGPRQGAVMIGVYRRVSANGTAAIFDGESRWIAGVLGGGVMTSGALPERMWEVKHEAA